MVSEVDAEQVRLRQAAMRDAWHSSRLEGVVIGPDARAVHERYAAGELSIEEALVEIQRLIGEQS